MDNRIKLNSSLEFGDDERAVYDFVADLTQKRRLTSTLMSLIRIYVNNPDIFGELMQDSSTEDLMKLRDDTLARLEANQSASITEYRKKLDLLATRLLALEKNLETLHTLLESKRIIGLSQRVEATFCAEVILRQQVRALQEELGFRVTTEKTVDIKTRTEDTLAYMIEHYEGAVNELQVMVGSIGYAPQLETSATRNVTTGKETRSETYVEQVESSNITGTEVAVIPPDINTPVEYDTQAYPVDVVGAEEVGDSESLFESMFG